jgi:Tfp pilus assembly protein PilX
MSVAITNTRITALNADQTLTYNAATSAVIDEAEVFTYTPTGKDNKILIGFVNGTGHGAYTYSIAGGAGVFGQAAKTGSIAAGATEVIQIESGRYMSAAGTVVITLTPASGKRLLTDHAANMWAAELQ